MKTIAIILLLLLCGCSVTQRHIAANALLVADWGQTKDASHDDSFVEANPILRDNPSSGEIDKYFSAVIAGYNLVYYVADEEDADALSVLVIVLEAWCVIQNKMLGVGFEF